MPSNHRRAWGYLARQQAGVVSRRQLRATGLSDDAVDRLVHAGALDRLDSGIFLARGAPLTYESQLWAAVCATRGSIGFASAAHLWGVIAERPDRIDVIVPWDRRVQAPAGVRLRRTAIPPKHDSTRHGMPTTSRTWSILDYLSSLPFDRACVVADRAVQRGWLTCAQLDQRVRTYPRRPGNTILRRLAAATGDGAAAESERLLHHILRQGKLTGWVPNLDIWADGDLIAVADVAFPAARLVIEIDGWAHHHLPDRFQRDRTRQNGLVADGWTVLRFTWGISPIGPGTCWPRSSVNWPERRSWREFSPRNPRRKLPPTGPTGVSGRIGGMVRRVAMLSVHTSPLDRPGGGDAGGMNVYIVETAARLAERDVEVEIFTRATASDQPPVIEMRPGVLVRHVTAGPFEGLGKSELPAQLCAFTAGVLRAEARHDPGWYDVIHSHYWLSGQVGWLARDRWGVPLVHTAHTLGKVKNAALADGDVPEPRARIIGEEQVVAEADQLVASTGDEARDLIELYTADSARVRTVPPGVDLDTFAPGSRSAARRAVGLPADRPVLLFVGRIQPLKAPDVLLRAAAELDDVLVAVLGAPSGSDPSWLPELAGELGIADRVRFIPPLGRAELAEWYRAADLTVVPSYNESFGLVALESQACGTPVVAAAVGGLPTAVADGISGALVDGHDPAQWAKVIDSLLAAPDRLAGLAASTRDHAVRFSWDRTTDGLLRAYEASWEGLRWPSPR